MLEYTVNDSITGCTSIQTLESNDGDGDSGGVDPR